MAMTYVQAFGAHYAHKQLDRVFAVEVDAETRAVSVRLGKHRIAVDLNDAADDADGLRRLGMAINELFERLAEEPAPEEPQP